MSARARFEVVRTDADQSWHARFRAANGRIVWHTENYTRRGRAVAAINSLVEPFLGCWIDPHSGQVAHRIDTWNKTDAVLIEVRDVDERGDQ